MTGGLPEIDLSRPFTFLARQTLGDRRQLPQATLSPRPPAVWLSGWQAADAHALACGPRARFRRAESEHARPILVADCPLRKMWPMEDSEPSLKGLRVAAFESRRADEIARLISRFGGVAHVSPSLREVPVAEDTVAAEFAHRLIVGEISVVIFLTGVGFQQLLAIAERHVDRQRFLDGLADIVTIARGPKPAFAMRERGSRNRHTSWQSPIRGAKS